MMEEQWMPMPGYEEFYLVSDHGQVFRLPRTVPQGDRTYRVSGRLLKGSLNAEGRPQITVNGGGRFAVLYVSVLVLTAFGPAKPSPEHWCLHWDDDPTNNHIDNLRWGTPLENKADFIRNQKRAS